LEIVGHYQQVVENQTDAFKMLYKS